MGTAIASVYVGPSLTYSSVHRDLLASRSPFFAKALNGYFSEATNGVVNLPDDDPAVFETYRQWLYRAKIACPTVSDSSSNEDAFKLLFKAYVFGDKIQDLDFLDAVMDSIDVTAKQTKRWFATQELVSFAYENTAGECPLRHILVFQYSFYGQQEWIPRGEASSEYPLEFLLDLSHGLKSVRLMREHNPWLADMLAAPRVRDPSKRCMYHHHKMEEPCWKDKY